MFKKKNIKKEVPVEKTETKEEGIAKFKRKEKKDDSAKKSFKNFLHGLILPVIFALIITGVIFVVIETKAEQRDVKKAVVVMRKNVANHTYINKNSFDKYFKIEYADAEVVPQGAFTNIDGICRRRKGIYLTDSLKKSEILMTDDIANTDDTMEKYKGGYQSASIAAQSFSNGVNGAVRSGDTVDIYALAPKDPNELSSNEKALIKYVSNAYVSDVRDNSGKKISVSDHSSLGTSYTIFVAPDEIEALNQAIINGNVQIYKN